MDAKPLSDGDQAFPFPANRETEPHAPMGMSMRQYYKAKAMPAVMLDHRYGQAGNEAACAHEIARYAGRIADEMVAEDAAWEERRKASIPAKAPEPDIPIPF